MRLLLALALTLALAVHAQSTAGEPAPKPAVPVEVHEKAVQLVEKAGVRDRLVASIPVMIEQGKTLMKTQCLDCDPAFMTEWGKRMIARLKVEDIVNVAVRAYEKRFTNDEFTELLAAIGSQKSGKPVPVSPALQKRLVELMPAIMGEITGACTEIGARLGSEIGAEIEKEHPEYFPAKAK